MCEIFYIFESVCFRDDMVHEHSTIVLNPDTFHLHIVVQFAQWFNKKRIKSTQ